MNIDDIIGRTAHRRDTQAALGPCTDLLIDTEDGSILYAALDIGLGSERLPVAAAISRLALEDGRLLLDVTDAEIAAQREAQKKAGSGPVDLSSAPPLVVGPFGNTFAPAMAGAFFNALTGKENAAPPRIDRHARSWHWFGNLRGLPVFDVATDLGCLDTLVMDPARFACVSLTVRNAKGELFNFPFATLRMVGRDEQSVVLELDSAPPYSARALGEGGGRT